jgi:signal transduction histidine kinase
VSLKRSASAAVARLVVGLWLMNTSTVVLYAGVHSVNIVVYPFLIAFAAWVLGTRWLVVMTGLTMAVVMTLGVAEHWGYFVPTPRVSPLHVAASICATLMVIAALVYTAYSSFHRSKNRVADLNNSLERKVAERTAALELALDELQRSRDELVRSEARATISTLVSSVSHELNTPLGLSLTVATTLLERGARFRRLVQENQLKRSDLMNFVDKTCEGSDLMHRNLTRAVELMKNFRQVTNDQASEQCREFDLLDVVQEVLHAMSPSLKRTTNKVVVDVPPGIILRSYPGPLGQVIINLVNNAYLHAFEGRKDGVLTINAQMLDDDHVQIECADNGVGMTSSVQERLFEVYFSTKTGQGGTGLGMSIVRNLVTHALQGQFDFESTPGVGSRFFITLPLVSHGSSVSQFAAFN